RDPAERYPTAEALATDLREWLAEQPGPADTAEVAAWMQRLFPGKAVDEEVLVQRALREILPAFEERASEDRSAVVRRSNASRLGLRATVGFYVLALVLAMGIGAIAALWPAS